jgi:hypothetical protein
MAFPLAFPWRFLGVFLGVPLAGKLGFCASSGKGGSGGATWRGMAGFGRHKTPKRSLAGLSKVALRWYIPLAPKGICQGLPSQEASGRDRRLRRWSIRFGFPEKGA